MDNDVRVWNLLISARVRGQRVSGMNKNTPTKNTAPAIAVTKYTHRQLRCTMMVGAAKPTAMMMTP
jgi:hypothetical protein